MSGDIRDYLVYLFFCIFAYVIFTTGYSWEGVSSLTLRYDSALRLLLVRDLLDDQSWYDNRLQNLMPPEGFSSHWSRYLDLILSSIIVGFRKFLPETHAEMAMLVSWPLLCYVLFVVISGQAALKIWGGLTARCVLVSLTIMASPFLGRYHFGQIDHHGLQLTLAAVCFFLITVLGGRVFGSAAAGVICAILLAINLDSFFFVAAVNLFIGLKWISSARNRGNFVGFYAAQFLGLATMYLVELSPDKWGRIVCDKYSIPMIVLTLNLALLSAVLANISWLQKSRQRVRAAIFFFFGVLAAGVYLVQKLHHCSLDPYANLSDISVKYLLSGHFEVVNIVEIFGSGFQWSLILIFRYMCTAIVLLYLTIGEKSYEKFWAINFLTLTTVFSIFGGLLQYRILSFADISVVFAFALVMKEIIQNWETIVKKLFGILGAWIFIFNPAIIIVPWLSLQGSSPGKLIIPPSEKGPNVSQCRNSSYLKSLQPLQPSVVIAPLNLGIDIALHSGVSVASIVSHRSPKGMDNAVLPFFGSHQDLLRTISAGNIDYVVLCADTVYENHETLGSRMSRGERIPGLKLEPGYSDVFRVYSVSR